MSYLFQFICTDYTDRTRYFCFVKSQNFTNVKSKAFIELKFEWSLLKAIEPYIFEKLIKIMPTLFRTVNFLISYGLHKLRSIDMKPEWAAPWSYNQNINFFQKFRSWLKVGACWDKDQIVKSVCFMSLKGLLMKLKSLFELMCCMKNPQLEFINLERKRGIHVIF